MCVKTGVQTRGVVESSPQDSEGKKTSASFLNNAKRNLSEQAGCTYIRSKGLHRSVMRTTVPSTRAPTTMTRADEHERCR
jgi:hypothetical protein